MTVRKPDGGVRICVDYRKLNAVTRPLPFYMPSVEETITAVGQAKYISMVDLVKGSWNCHESCH